MSDPVSTGCITRFVDGLCGNPPTSGLTICGSCLRTLLDEPDPRRRRILAANPGLAAGVVQTLAEDPDDQVRARVAARDDLDPATTNRLADPDRESSPRVWQSMAATAGGATHAWELLGTDDPATLSILAGNPAVDPDILEQLARYPDPDVSWTAAATLAGQPAGDHITSRIREAREVDGRPLDEPPVPLTRPTTTVDGEPSATPSPTGEEPTQVTPVTPTGEVPPTGQQPPGAPPPATVPAAGAGGGNALPPRPTPTPEGSGRPRGIAFLVGAGALIVVAIVVLVIAFSGGDSDQQATTVAPAATTTTSTPVASTTTVAPTSSSTSSTTSTSTTTSTTTTVPPTTPTLPTTQPPSTFPPPISQNFTIRPDSGRFCDSADVTVNFSPSPGYVTITDDSGAQVATWSGPSGQTRTVPLPRPTSALHVAVTVIGNSISVSGTATGGSC